MYVNLPMTYNADIINCTFKDSYCREAPSLNFYPSSTSSNSLININNSTFKENIATLAGGAIAINGTKYTITNSTIVDNSAGFVGGGLLLKNITLDPSILGSNKFSNKALKGNDVGLSISRIRVRPVIAPNSTLSVRNISADLAIVEGANLTTSADIGLIIDFLDEAGDQTIDYSQTDKYLTVNFENQSTIYSNNCSISHCTIDRLGKTACWN